MVRPVQPWRYRFLRKKNFIAWIPTCACIIEWPFQVVRCSLVHQKRFFSDSSSIDKRIEASQFFMVILEREISVQIGKGLTQALCILVISSSFVQSLL